MPKNNSKDRKDERKERARVRDVKKTVHDCGHWHTDNGAKMCKDK